MKKKKKNKRCEKRERERESPFLSVPFTKRLSSFLFDVVSSRLVETSCTIEIGGKDVW